MLINGQLIGAIIERFSASGKPGAASAQAGRFIYLTDTKRALIDADGTWKEVYFVSAPVTISSSRAITEEEFKNGTVLLDGTSEAIAVTLPAAANVTGYKCTIKCINSTNACSITTNVDGEAYYFAGKYDRIDAFSDGTNYYK